MAQKISLSIKERMYFPTLMLQHGNTRDIEIVRALKQKVAITEKEADECEIRQLSGGRVAWKEKNTEFSFEDFEILYMKAGRDQAESEGRMTEDNIDLALRFDELQLTKKKEK